MRKRKFENYFVIAVALVLLTIVFAIAYISSLYPAPEEVSSSLTPSPVSTERTLKSLPVYDETAQKTLMDKIEHRVALSQEDIQAKKQILSLLPPGKQSGILYTSENIIIDYIKGPNLFQVEILTPDISSAKAEANVWFRSQGMSQFAICNYPVDFYLSWEVREKLRGKNILFSPLATNCE